MNSIFSYSDDDSLIYPSKYRLILNSDNLDLIICSIILNLILIINILIFQNYYLFFFKANIVIENFSIYYSALFNEYEKSQSIIQNLDTALKLEKSKSTNFKFLSFVFVCSNLFIIIKKYL